ncbi:MAG: hypothetical protein M3063_12595 [Actinomycetota bacterium]|nr:hypothetical protein [Actinomycetota bacterium]
MGGLATVVAGCGQTSATQSPVTSLRPTTTGPAASVGAVANGASALLGSGQATLTGTVVGPAGPQQGASVEIERHADGLVARTTLISGIGGAWAVRGVPGGSYSVRAWRSPDLAQTTPRALFLAGRASQVVTLELTGFSAPLVQSAVAPDPPVSGEPSHVVVQVITHQVQPDGIVANQPAAGLSVQLVSQGSWQIGAPNPTTTDASGQATWTATCATRGDQSLEVDLIGLATRTGPSTTSPFNQGTSSGPTPDAGAVPLQVPACHEAPPATTRTPSTAPTPSSSTTKTPNGGTSTTGPSVGR